MLGDDTGAVISSMAWKEFTTASNIGSSAFDRGSCVFLILPTRSTFIGLPHRTHSAESISPSQPRPSLHLSLRKARIEVNRFASPKQPFSRLGHLLLHLRSGLPVSSPCRRSPWTAA